MLCVDLHIVFNTQINSDFKNTYYYIHSKLLKTRILGRYAPLILAPAESSSLEPCTLDKLFNYFYSRLCFSSRLRFSNEVRHTHITGNGIISMWEELPVA